MANKRWKEIKDLSADEVTSKLRTAELELFQARMKKETGQLGDTAQLWRIRKDIARMKSLQAQKAAAGSARK